MYKKICLLLSLILVVFSGYSANKKKVEQSPKTRSHLSESDQRRFDYFFYQGLNQKENRQYDQAIETFQLCVKLDSLDSGVQSELGLMYGAIGFTGASINCLEKAIKTDPENWWYNVQLISIYSELKNWKRCIEIASNLQKLYPNKEEIYTMQASFYKETKQFDKAIAAYDHLETLVGINQNISFEKFQLYIILNNQKKGIAEIDKLVNKYPTESRYKVFRGDIYLQQKMAEKAFEIYQQVLKDDPQNAITYVSLSNYYKYKNEPEKALQSIVSALKSEQLDAETKVQVLGQYVEKLVHDSTKLSETESLFKMLVDRYPMEEQVHGYYAVFLQFQKRIPEAVSELESMININAKNDQTWMRLIQINIGQKDYKQMVTIADRAIKNLPKLPLWYFYKGIAEFQLVDYPAALVSYKAGLPLVAADQPELKSDFYAQIADTYFKIENKDSAFVNYEKALVANPKNIMVMNNYAYYLSLDKKDLKKAERMSAKTVELEPKNSTYLDTYAWILYQEDNFMLAKYYIERAVDNMKKDEESGVIWEHYGDILWKTKDEAKALKMWQKGYDAGNKTDDLKKKIENKGWKK
jgi:tetratricopeptide (TPR) repeat protein